jgi:hypothetical protein
MAVTLNASTSSGLIQTADTSGNIELQNNGTTRLTVNSSGATIPTAIVTTLSDGTNSTSATNCIQGSAKAWVYYNGSTQTIISSFNISSVTRTATGYFTVAFTTAMPNANYVVAGSVSESTGGAASTSWTMRDVNNPRTTTTFYIWTLVSSGTAFNDNPNINLVVFSS